MGRREKEGEVEFEDEEREWWSEIVEWVDDDEKQEEDEEQEEGEEGEREAGVGKTEEAAPDPRILIGIRFDGVQVSGI